MNDVWWGPRYRRGPIAAIAAAVTLIAAILGA